MSLYGPSIEEVVITAFFDAIRPAQLDALSALLTQQAKEEERIVQHHHDQVRRATYEAHLARRRYEAVDPDNRLVAASLERCWEEKLLAAAAGRRRGRTLSAASDLSHSCSSIASAARTDGTSAPSAVDQWKDQQ